MSNPIAHASATEQQAPQALLQSFYISDADITQVLMGNIDTEINSTFSASVLSPTFYVAVLFSRIMRPS